MADIINMPSPAPRSGLSGSLVAGLGLLVGGAYFLWKKYVSRSSGSNESVSGGTYTDEIIDSIKNEIVEVSSVSSAGSGSAQNENSGSSNVYKGSGYVSSLLFGYDDYKPATTSSVTTMLYGHTKEEQAEILRQLSAADALRPNSYTIQVTRQGRPVTYTVSGTTGAYGESTNAVVENSLMMGSSSSGTSNAAQALIQAIESKGTSSGTSSGSGFGSGGTSRSSSNAAQALIQSIESGGISSGSGGTSGSSSNAIQALNQAVKFKGTSSGSGDTSKKYYDKALGTYSSSNPRH